MKTHFCLVYQSGIANVFLINSFLGSASLASRRKCERVLQHTFRECEAFVRGAAKAGAKVETFACNRAGDIINENWTSDLENQPFSDKFNPIFSEND